MNQNVEIRPGQRWQDEEKGVVTVMAVADGYAMCRRRRRNPFIASVAQMERGDYGWRLIEEEATPPSTMERLRALLEELVDIEGPLPGNAQWAKKVKAELARLDGAG